MSNPPTGSETTLAFVADPKADVVLKSSDDTSFPIRRVHLQSSCEAFDDMFSAGTGEADAEKDDKTGLPIIRLDDSATGLDLFLRYLDREQSRSSGRPLSFVETKTLIHLADKYGARALLDAIDLASLRSFAAFDPPGLFGFAMSHGLTETARLALTSFQKGYFCCSVYTRRTGFSDQDMSITGGLPHFLTDVPEEDLARIPFSVLYALESAQVRVLFKGSSWSVEADKIKLT